MARGPRVRLGPKPALGRCWVNKMARRKNARFLSQYRPQLMNYEELKVCVPTQWHVFWDEEETQCEFWLSMMIR